MGAGAIHDICLEENHGSFSHSNTHLVCLQLCLTATHCIYSVPCISPLLSPVVPSFYFYGFPSPPLLPSLSSCAAFLCLVPHWFPSRVFFRSFLILIQTNKSIPSTITSLLLCGSKIWSLFFGRLPDCFYTSFLSFPTVLDHGRGCWAYSLSIFTLKYCFLLFLLLCFFWAALLVIFPHYSLLPGATNSSPSSF